MPTERQSDHEIAVQTGKPETAPPPRFAVLMMNDDFTPMDFVIDVLMRFFNMNIELATQVMLRVHTEGSAVCGLYSRDVAETKVAQVMELARRQHPLLSRVEKA